MFSLPTLLVIMLLALKFHTVQSGKCPKFCICDNIQLTVACVNKNLTEVPPTIDEVICAPAWSLWPYFYWISIKLCNFALLFFKLPSVYLQDNSETRPERKWHAGASYRGVHTHPLPHSPVAAEQQHPKGAWRGFPQTWPAGLTQPGQQQDWDSVPGKASKTQWIGVYSCNPGQSLHASHNFLSLQTRSHLMGFHRWSS